MTGQVYFLRPVGQEGPVKIGFSRLPQGRLATYQSWSPVALEIAAELPATPDVERRLHARFAHLHMWHEWFSADAELSRLIEEVRAGAFDASRLPEPGQLHPRKLIEWPLERRIAASLTHRVWSARVRGHCPPKRIADAVYRFANGERGTRLGRHSPEDRAVVEEWLSAHAKPSKKARNAAARADAVAEPRALTGEAA